MKPVRFVALLTLILAGCTAAPEGVVPVSPFEFDRYKGTWFEIARLDHSFERGLSNVTATYTLNENGTVKVTNRGFNKKTCRFEEAVGTARFQGASDVGSLSVSFFWPISGGYHVIALDTKAYEYAVVAGPSRSYLWLLARTPTIDADLQAQLVANADAKNFPVENLIFVNHDSPICLDASG